jgi:hypothetical protein
MLIRGIIPEKGKPDKFLIEADEEELDLISGIAGTPHISDRYRVGTEIAPAEVYNRLKEFTNNREKFKQAQNSLRQTADSIQGILDLNS